ncbi:MAG: DUF5069 domain-containing protein [Akkermansiaceae bacterium]|nr:DUF5069 domain-containing protein [Akkermansiaceae bacterium]
MSDAAAIPRSPKEELDGLPYFPRLCDKVRLQAAGTLHPDYGDNLGGGMDLWTCQFLGVDYDDLAKVIRDGASDEEALAWARAHGVSRPDHERDWWLAYMHTIGFRVHLAERLVQRKAESNLTDRDDIQTMFDYIDADDEMNRTGG